LVGKEVIDTQKRVEQSKLGSPVASTTPVRLAHVSTLTLAFRRILFRILPTIPHLLFRINIPQNTRR